MKTLDLLHDVVDEPTRVEYAEKGIQCISVEDVRSFINANKNEDLQFNISTLGGNLAAAITISSLIKSHPKKTIGNIVGLTASAGTVIADSCDETIMSDNTLFLVHNGWKEVTGNVYDFQKAAEDLAKSDAIMIKLYREKTKLPDEKIIEIMKASDWMSPVEAEKLGFIDRIYSGSKIAASAIISSAKEQNVNELLILKLKEKMLKFPWQKETKAGIVGYPLALVAGTAIMNAEVPAPGVEIAPLGAMSLEDGEYELADGRKITVAGGVITVVTDPAAPAMDAVASTEEVVAAVAPVIAAEIAKVEAKFMAELGKIQSTHTPVKGVSIAAPSAKAQTPQDSAAKVEAIAAGIQKKIQESRKA